MAAADFIVFGHRGVRGHAPENTLKSMQLAIDLGLAWVELDVHAVEHRLVVIHDERLERTTNGSGKLRRRSLSYIRSLDAGDGERIPFLEEVLDLIDRRLKINIELKSRGSAELTARALRRYVAKYGWQWDDFMFRPSTTASCCAFTACCLRWRSARWSNACRAIWTSPKSWTPSRSTRARRA